MLATESLLPCDTSLSQAPNTVTTSVSTFKFPPPPAIKPVPVLSSPNVMSTSDVETNSDTSADDYAATTGNGSRSKISKVSNSVPVPTSLPPIGVFWDIENCQIPRGRSALSVAQSIRDNFFDGYREVEFVVVCDVKKENAQIIQELNDAQVNLIHVSSTCKNAADAKLRQSIRRFADIHAAPAAIILISGDVNFAADLSDLRHRKKMHVILLHNDRCSDSLILCASEHHDYTALVSNLPLRGTTCKVTASGPAEVLVTGLPAGMDHSRIRNRLKRLSENCGGRVGVISDYTTTIRFPNYEFALRCQKRIDQEPVFGSKFQGGGYQNNNNNQENIQDPTANFQLWHSQNNKSSFQNYHRGVGGGTGGRPVLGANTAPNGNVGHYCKSSTSGNTASSQPITILKRSSPLPPNFVFSINTSIPPPPIVNIPQSNSGSNVLNTSNGSSGQNSSLKRSSPLPPNFVFSINTSIPPPPIVNIPQSNSGSNVLNTSNGSSGQNSSILNERYFHPISTVGGPHSSSSPVELHVTNLDQNIEPGDLKRILGACFSEHVTCGVHVSVFTQSDGTLAAAVKLRSAQDAQVAISQLHRKKIGFKRISISYSHSGTPYHSPALIRSQVISLLQEVPKYNLPLFKFREMFEMRYSTSISVSELYKMKDVCTISEESTGRTIVLNPDHRDNTASSPVNRQSNSTPLLEQPYCTLHFKLSRQNSCATLTSCEDKGWAELEASVLPNLKIPLSTFSEHVHSLIDSHSGALPLLSFPDCYEAQFGSLVPDDSGVPLEHLVTCIKGVELVLNNYAGIKYLRKQDPNATVNNIQHSSDEECKLADTADRKLVIHEDNLIGLKLFRIFLENANSRILLTDFINIYRKLYKSDVSVEDLGAASDIVRFVMGEGSRRLITLSHRAQMRRFTSDLLRCLKSVPNKQCSLGAFPAVFTRVHSRPFDPVDYGLGSLTDLLANVPENTVVVSQVHGGDASSGEDVMIAVPKREQTPDEIERTKKFSREVVEVLSHMPHYSILFNKFIPSYHHHYGHQCRVADFGFTKLIELFESIPEVVTIEDDIEDRRITLTIKEKLAVLLEQTKSLITLRSPITLDNLNASFSWQFGYPLRPVCYGCDSLEELVKKLEPNVKVVDRKLVIHEDNLIGLKLFRIFLENANSRILLTDFINIYRKLYKSDVSVEDLVMNFYHLLYSCDGKISLSSLEPMYLKTFGTAVQCAVYGHQSLSSLLGAIANVVTVKGKHKQKILILNRSLSLVGISLPRENNNEYVKNHNNNNNHYEQGQGRGYRSNGYKYASDDEASARYRKDTSYGCHDNEFGSYSDGTSGVGVGGPVINMPDFKIHPDTFTCTPLTSPYKGLSTSAITAPHPSELPLPPFQMNF
ncbi:LOW QUALITY PROTEIN: meiosis regulator and mRNA stability factor 1 [Diaphorina citri]|uniref:LOW QUALITY PROTEIN: meiosis regulator and mRNA stability factor 1 n=1 Tax=Diaphorina citri TaxID=121845 RepID=A0A3Q0IIM6_DIACI|nr:LOW QUALITY PROTEIN: meiosis regulator and mRNA stability factor 1 [Diaphorina citri]